VAKKIRHDWNTWDNYFNVHEKVLKNYSANFVNPQIKYKDDRITDNYYTLVLDRAEVRTQKGNTVFVKIEKDVEVQQGARKKIARTYGYSYHCWQKNGDGTDQNLIRYCSPHPDHNKFHHKHEYLATSAQSKLIRIDDDEWPHVNEFLDEVIKRF